MSKFKNYYEVLELDSFADLDTIKSAFRRLARKYHPDLNAGDKISEERFKSINEAYDTLGNIDKKSAYDHSLKLYLGRQSQAAKASYSQSKPTQEKPSDKTSTSKDPKKSTKENGKGKSTPTPKNTTSESSKSSEKTTTTPPPPPGSTPINEFFDSFLKRGFNPGGNTAKGARNQDTPPPSGGQKQRGPDVQVTVSISPVEAEQGLIKSVNLQHNDICRRCAGTGLLNGLTCSQCQGEKVLSRTKKIDVRIPAGVKNRSKVRVAKEGGRGQNGGDPGDLFLLIQIDRDANSGLRVDGLTVYYDLTIPVTLAVLGGEIQVPTLQGLVKMNIPPCTSSGKVFRMKDQGATVGNQRGDQLVTVSISVPKTLTPEVKALYEALAKLETP